MYKSWKYNGCRGRFFTRETKSGTIIYYYFNKKKRSTGFKYSRKNIMIAGETIKRQEAGTAANSTITLAEAFRQFVRENSINKQPGTIDNYFYAFKNLIDKNYNLKQTDKIREMILENINKSKLADYTLKGYVARLRSFFEYCKDENLINKNPIMRSMIPKVAEIPVDIFTKNEIAALLKYWRKNDRDFYVLLKLLYITAFRINEALNLRWSDIKKTDYKREIFLKKSKFGNTYNTFPFSPRINSLLKSLPGYMTEGYIFPRWKNKDSVKKKLKRSMVKLNIPPYVLKTEGKPRGFHSLRKARITFWAVKKGLPPQAIVKLSRDRIETVMKYYAQFKGEDLSQYL